MEEGTDQETKKGNNRVWIIIGLAALGFCFCCLLVAIGMGLYLTFGPESSVSDLVPIPMPLSAPTEASLVPEQPEAFESLDIEAFYPGSANYPSLAELVPGWQPSLTPAVQNWSISMQSQPVQVILGWCTMEWSMLEQNYEHISYVVSLDGREISLADLNLVDDEFTDRVCRSYFGVIRQWSPGEHVIVTTMIFDETINDGWDDYPAGEYMDFYSVTITP